MKKIKIKVGSGKGKAKMKMNFLRDKLFKNKKRELLGLKEEKLKQRFNRLMKKQLILLT